MAAQAQLLDDRKIAGGGSAALYLDDERFLNFAGCNYLALNDRPELQDAARSALDDGSLHSRYLVAAYGGIDPAFAAVEREAAAFYGTEAAVYFASGYLIGFAALTGLSDLFDVIVLDEQTHWCMTDAAKLQGTDIYRFSHCDADSLAQVLEEHCKDRRPLVATDGAFATTGTLPPLDVYAQLIDKFDGQLLVDESHSAGGVGKHGRGAIEHFGLRERAHVGTTLSKGLCGLGSVFVGTQEAVAKARMCHALRGSNPGSPLSAKVSAAALKLVREEPQLVADLQSNADYLRKGLQALGLEIVNTPAPIVAFSQGDFDFMRSIQQTLFDEKIYVLHSNYIAAGPGGTIRFTIFRDHTHADLDRAIELIAKIVN